jgi:aldehyde dehydrogenase (NAD+)
MGVPFTQIDRLYIDGEWAKPAAGASEAVLNPATEVVIGMAPVGGKAEADAAIAAARHAFDHGPWPHLPMAKRIEYVQRFKAGVEKRAEAIKALLTAEVGSTFMLNETLQYGSVLLGIDYAIELAGKLEPEFAPIQSSVNLMNPIGPKTIGAGVTIYEPIGVVACIAPYNFPFLLTVSKVIPAILAGNTTVLKPSPLTPYCSLLIGEIAEEAQIPKGVVNVITGGLEVGELLSSDPRVDMVSFTGSDTVGASIMAQAAPTLKRLQLELGGKSALIVRGDADLETAALAAIANITTHCGQGCALSTRIIVHNSIRPQLVELLAMLLSGWSIGDPADSSIFMGPLIRDAARAKTERYVQIGLDSGATLAYGGKRPAHLDKGYFFEPTLFDNVDNRSRIAQEEVFGPVGVVIGFDKDDEAVAIANESKFGLHGGVLSADRSKAYELALRIRSGQIWINGGTGNLYVKVPFGGVKRSGFGREMGPRWLKEFMQEKAIVYPIG